MQGFATQVFDSQPARSSLAPPAAGLPAILTIAGLGMASAVAAGVTGGVAGPFGVWCLAPVAAAAVMGRPDRLALGASVSLGAAGLAAIGGLTLPGIVLHPAYEAVLGVLALATITLGLAAGLVVLQRGAGLEARRTRMAEAQLRRVLDEHPGLLLSLDDGGRIGGAWGAGANELDAPILGSVFDLAEPAARPRLEAALARASADGAAEVGFVPAADPDGWLMLVVRRRGARLAASLHDARAARRRELELERAQAEAEAQNAGKSRFLANMSHELRTPLNAIMGFSDIMRQRLFGPISDRYAEYAELIHESGGHLLDLINDVLDMSKIEADRYELSCETFDARDAALGVQRLMRGQAERAGVQLRTELPRESLEVLADRRALKQIVLNLISNALKFTPRGGTVSVGMSRHAQVLELVVADTGVGIGPEDLQRLGRPFEQAGAAAQKAGGAGLGLSLVRSFAELHGGGMVIESRLGEGTTVTVRLPVFDRPLAANAP